MFRDDLEVLESISRVELQRFVLKTPRYLAPIDQ
jgi:hypothetical protein